jgi:hypothetical protein
MSEVQGRAIKRYNPAGCGINTKTGTKNKRRISTYNRRRNETIYDSYMADMFGRRIRECLLYESSTCTYGEIEHDLSAFRKRSMATEFPDD